MSSSWIVSISFRERGDSSLNRMVDVEFKPATRKDKAQIVLSPTPSFSPKPVILYRTLPRYTGENDHVYRPAGPGRPGQKIVSEDKALRPDLRLGRSDPGVRRVADTVAWFSAWVGGQGP